MIPSPSKNVSIRIVTPQYQLEIAAINMIPIRPRKYVKMRDATLQYEREIAVLSMMPNPKKSARKLNVPTK
jgi:hypothetical protein